jgi:membrane protein DedA with SNARE-associated domain
MPGSRAPAVNGWFAAALVVGSLWAFSVAMAQDESRAVRPLPDAEGAVLPDAAPVQPHIPDGRVAALIERFTYAAIIAVLLLCGMGLPLPEEVPILTSAILSQSGHLQPWWALGACMFGVMLGDSIMFLLGQRWGPHVLEHRLSRKLLTSERQARIGTYFARYGAWIIFAARFLPGIRAPLFLTAGSMRVSFWMFFAMDGAAALVSIPASFWIAYYFTDKLEELLNLRERVHYWALVMLAVGLLGWLVLHRLWGRWRAAARCRANAKTAQAGASQTNDPDEVACNR